MTTHHTIITVLRCTFLIAASILCSHAIHCQSPLSLNFVDTIESKHLGISTDKKFDDSLTVHNYLAQKIGDLRNQGYLSSGVDQIRYVDSTWMVDFYLGKKYVLGRLKIDSIEQGIIDEANYRMIGLENKPMSAELLSTTMNNLLKALTHNGYPFASTQLSNSSYSDDGELSAELTIDKGKLILIDSLNVYGGAQISSRYLEKYLQIEKGDRYDESKILKIKSKVKQLPFLQMSKNPSVSFFNEEAVINLELKNKNASRFDFIIGLLQNESDNSDRFTFIYDFSAEMQNKLGAGEQIFLQFKRVQPEIQDLDVAVNYPYLLDLPFGIDAEFSLYRNTTRNVDLDTDVGIQYFLGGNNFIKASWDYFSSNLLDIDTTRILRSGVLPDRLDVAYNALGLTGNIENLDYRFNPRKGYSANIKSSIGIKKILENPEIINLQGETIDFSSAYDTLNADAIQFDLSSTISYYLPIGNRSTLKTNIKSGIKKSEQNLFQNELFRIGGSKVLRGFDEETIFTDVFHIITLEYRLLLGENSFLAAFADYGFVRNNLEEWDKPFGIGAGMNFETGAGLFGISTAVGRVGDQAFNFRNAKIHFGYISLF